MMIDKHGTHKRLRKDQLTAAFLVQLIAWIEESHNWQTFDKQATATVRCEWCGAERLNYYGKLTDMEVEDLRLCPENPVLKGFCGDPSVHYSLSRIRP